MHIRIVDRYHSGRLDEPSTSMMETVKHYFEKPCPAIGAELETMKRLPGFQIRILYQVFGLMPVPQEQAGSAK